MIDDTEFMIQNKVLNDTWYRIQHKECRIKE